MGYQGKARFYLGLKCVLLSLIFLSPLTAISEEDRVVTAQEARDLLPHIESFSIPATRQVIAIALTRNAWRPGAVAQRDRLQVLALASIQLGLLQEFGRRARENADAGSDHGEVEFTFFQVAVQQLSRAAAGKTGSVGDQDDDWFSGYTEITDVSMTGVGQILDVYGNPEEDVETTEQFAREMMELFGIGQGFYDAAEDIAVDVASYIPARFASGIRQVATASTTLSAGKNAETRERIRVAVEENRPVRTEEVRRTTEVTRTYNRVSRTVSAVMVTAVRTEYEDAVQSAEAVAATIVREIREFIDRSGTVEICDNQVDDDGDLFIDCDDSDCANAPGCCRTCN